MILEGLLIFIVIAFFSFVSNIPPGFVNIKVIETSLFRGFYNGVKVALGAATAEFSYCALALITGYYINQMPRVSYGIDIVVVIILLVLAYFYFTGPSYAERMDPSKIEFKDDKKKHNYLLFGMRIGFFNPQMFPYWFVFYKTINSAYKIQYQSSYYVFVVAAILGGFGLLFMYSYFAARYRKKIFLVFKKYDINRYVGWMFLGMAALKIVELISDFPPK